MANRNFDSRVIIQRLQNKNYARNLYQQNVNGQRLINNPQNSDGNSSRYVTYVPGAQTEYFRGLMNGPPTINLGGTFGIPSIPPSTAPVYSSVPGSMYFDPTIVSNGSHVSYPNNSSLAIGTQSFTIECYHYFIRGEMFPRLFSIGSYSEESISIAVSYEEGEGINFIFWKNNSANFIGRAPPYDAWTHIAIVGTTNVGIKIYQNGVEIGEVEGAYDFTDTTTPLMIGNESVPTQETNFKGNITNFRWVVGQALYTTTFTPPTIPLANITGTQLLLAVSNELGVVADSSTANRTPTNTGVTYSRELPPMPFVSLPTAPSITNITGGNASLTVTFTAPVSDGGSAIVYYQYSTDYGFTFLNSGTTTSPITITLLSDGSGSLINGTTYYIVLKAVNSLGPGSDSNGVPGTPSLIPSAPTITSITPGNTALTVNFTPPTSVGSSPIIYYEYSLDSGLNYFVTRTANSPVIIPGLINGTSYDIVIRAVNSEEEGLPSNIVSAIPSTTPSPPTDLSGTPGDRQITISFTAGNNGGSAITNYQYTTDGGTTYLALNPEDASSPITITKRSSDNTDLTNGVTYTVRLKAVNANGLSTASSSISVTPILITVPPEPTALSAVGGDQAIYVLFTQSGNGGSAITNYQYSVDGGPFVAFNPEQTFSPVEITTSDGSTPLTNGTSYSVRLKAVNIVGPSIESASTSAIPMVNSLNTTSLLVELDANNPASYSGSGTAWTNLQSAGLYSATLLNGPTFDNVDKYFTFDGINQIAQIPAAAAINPTVGSSFTIQIWARVNTSSPNFSSFDGVISKQFGPGSYDGYSLSLIADTSVQLTMNGQSVNGRYSSSTGVYSNGWALYTIVVRFGGGSGSPSYAYVSTRRVVTADNSESFMPSQAPIQFPRGIQDSIYNYCPADVGAFYVYNAAVSQEDIIRNYDATKTQYGL
jgi:hypothetical protein